jgi:hypothetical protein
MHNRRMGKQTKAAAKSVKPAAKASGDPPAGTRAALLLASSRSSVPAPFPPFVPSTGSEAAEAKEAKRLRRENSIAIREQRAGGASVVAALLEEGEEDVAAEMEVVEEDNGELSQAGIEAVRLCVSCRVVDFFGTF